MKKIFAVSFAFLTMVAVQNAHAAFTFEPYGGYSFGTYKNTPKSGFGLTESKGTTSGLMLGARAYVDFVIPFVGLDASYGALSVKSDRTGSSDNGNQAVVYVIGGAKVPLVGLGAYAGYGFYDAATFKDGGDEYVYTGSAIKVGLTFRILPLVHLNAEYIMHQIKKLKYNGTEYALDTYYEKNEMNQIMVGIAVPLSI